MSELEVPVELGPEDGTPTGLRRPARVISAGCGARHPNRGQHTLQEERPRTESERDMQLDANELRHLLR